MRSALCGVLRPRFMKKIDIDKLDQLPGRKIEAGDTFNFRCYPGIGCFNLCCRNLNLFIYPYDLIRLKNALGISSVKKIPPLGQTHHSWSCPRLISSL